MLLKGRQGTLNWHYPANGRIVSSGAIVFTSVVFASQDRWLYVLRKNMMAG